MHEDAPVSTIREVEQGLSIAALRHDLLGVDGRVAASDRFSQRPKIMLTINPSSHEKAHASSRPNVSGFLPHIGRPRATR